METNTKVKATRAQADYLFNNFNVRLLVMDKTKEAEYISGSEPVFTFKAVIRHAEDTRIPNRCKYEKLLNILLDERRRKRREEFNRRFHIG